MKFVTLTSCFLCFCMCQAATIPAENPSIEIRDNGVDTGLERSVRSIPMEVGLSSHSTEIIKRDIPLLTEFFRVLDQSGLVLPVLKILATNRVTEPILVSTIVTFLRISNLEDLLHSADSSGLAVDIVVEALSDVRFFQGAFSIIDGLRNGATTTPPNPALNIASLASAVSPIMQTYRSDFTGLDSTFSDIESTLGFNRLNTGIFSLFGDVSSRLRGSSSGSSRNGGSNVVSSISSGSASATTSNTATSTARPTRTSQTSTQSTGTPTRGSTSSSSSSSSSSISSLLSRLRGLFDRSKRDESSSEILTKRDNELLDQLVDSLENSGLAMSVVEALFIDRDYAPFVRDLIKKIVQQNAITLDELSSALDNTNILNDAVIGTLRSGDLRISIS